MQGNSRILRFGIVCDSHTLQEWQAKCIERLANLPNAKLALIISTSDNPMKENVFSGIRKFPKKAMLKIYKSFFAKPMAFNCRDWAVFLPKTPKLFCRSKKENSLQCFEQSGIQNICANKLDFILNFSKLKVCGEIANAAAYGVWEFYNGDPEKGFGCIPAFWEIYNKDPIINLTLRKAEAGGCSGIVLKEGFFATCFHSASRSINQAFFEAANWPARVCTDIESNNAGYFGEKKPNKFRFEYREPNSLEFAIFFLKLLNGIARQKISLHFRKTFWNVGIVAEPIWKFLEPDFKPQILYYRPDSKHFFFSDPFGITVGKKTIILCEELDLKSQKGHISALEFDGSKISGQETAIKRNFHMSYPFLFEFNGKIYCIPETSENWEIAIYKAGIFPKNWKKAKTIVKNFDGVDPTIFQYGGFWWLACGSSRTTPFNLFLWYAENPFGEWKAHSANPVKTDVRSARPAGTPFMHNGSLYRPAQNCSEDSGKSITINKVLKLTPQTFEEIPARTIVPQENGFYPEGIHTISLAGKITLVDGKKSEFAIPDFKKMQGSSR